MDTQSPYAQILPKVVFSQLFLQLYHNAKCQMELFNKYHFQFRKKDLEYHFALPFVDLEYLLINLDSGQFNFMKV